MHMKYEKRTRQHYIDNMPVESVAEDTVMGLVIDKHSNLNAHVSLLFEQVDKKKYTTHKPNLYFIRTQEKILIHPTYRDTFIIAQQSWMCVAIHQLSNLLTTAASYRRISL